MPKAKTKKSILKRFKITGNLQVLRRHQYSRHRRAHKTKRRIRHFAEPQKLTTKQARIVRSFIQSS